MPNRHRLLQMCLFLLSFFNSVMGVEPKRIVWVYDGPGVSKESLAQTLRMFRTVLNAGYEVRLLDPQQLLEDSWEAQAALFVMPGGADLPYCAVLNGPGNEKISAYVQQGGSYLGICAGAYYAGGYVDFAPGTPLEVCGSRELAFFPGIVKGPLLAPYEYGVNSGARAAEIQGQDGNKYTLLFNGGCYFVDALRMPGIQVLASYSLGDEYPAIVECEYGMGKAILSGVHFEYDPEYLDPEDSYYQALKPLLENGNIGREELIRNLLLRLCEKDNDGQHS